jgi:predicted ATPase/DNA-binding CsgD family transcriptional regulator
LTWCNRHEQTACLQPSHTVCGPRQRALRDHGLLNPECRLLTLTGLGGCGKTRLAIEVATTLATQFQHGALFVALQPIPRADLLASAIGQTVGLTSYGEAEPREQLLAYFQDKIALLILDNFEHLLDGATFVSDLLAAAPGVTVLATSREALRLQEEWLYPLKGLQTPPSIYATSLEEYEAVQLFLSHARRVQPTFDLAGEHEAVIRICMLTAGLPLALELAASWLKGLRAAHIAQAMHRTLDLLSTTTRNIEPRHRSMRAVFDTSWALLSDHERLVFARLSVFRGGFASDAAAQVAGASLADLVALVEKSLVQVEATDRFGIHELLRQYTSEQLEAIGEAEAAHVRHSDYFAELMRKYEATLKGSDQLEAMRAIEHDFENIRLAWEWSTRHGQVGHLHAMLDGLYLFASLSSRYRETMALFRQALEQPVADEWLRGRLLTRRWGYLHWWYQADYSEPLTSIEHVLTRAQEQDSPFEVAFCDLMAAYALMSMQRYAEAVPRLERSLARFETLGEPYYVCWVLHRLGYAFYNLNDPVKGNEYTEHCLTLARATANLVPLVNCLNNLSSDFVLKGNYVQARHYCTEALHVASEMGHQARIAFGISMHGLCAFFEGDYTTAWEHAQRSWTIVEDFTVLSFQASNCTLLILLACLREDYAEGVRLKGLTDGYTTNVGGQRLLAWALAVLSCGLGRPAEARASIEAVLERSQLSVQRAVVMWLAPCAAYIFAGTDPAKAVEMLAWVYSYPDSTLNWARQWPLVDRLQTQLHAALGDERYQAHWEHGKILTLETIAGQLDREFQLAFPAAARAGQHDLLTAREREILALLATGKSNPQIAAQLIIGAGTVKTHTLNIYRKLEVANRTQAIVRAQELGLLPT